MGGAESALAWTTVKILKWVPYSVLGTVSYQGNKWNRKDSFYTKHFDKSGFCFGCIKLSFSSSFSRARQRLWSRWSRQEARCSKGWHVGETDCQQWVQKLHSLQPVPSQSKQRHRLHPDATAEDEHRGGRTAKVTHCKPIYYNEIILHFSRCGKVNFYQWKR